MSVLGTTIKVTAGAKAARSPLVRGVAAKGAKTAPPAARLIVKPGVRRRTRKRIHHTVEGLSQAFAGRAPRTARRLGLKPPKRKLMGPRVVVGAIIVATGVYLLEPDHRRQLHELLG